MSPPKKNPPDDVLSSSGAFENSALQKRVHSHNATTAAAAQRADETAAHMMALFACSHRSHVTYVLGSERTRESDGKIMVAYRTVKRPVTVDLWRRHLAGRYPLVVALACDDGTSRCSIVDVDDYAVGATNLAATVKAQRLPFFVRPSKSGGAHVYAFHNVPIPIAEAESFARRMAHCLDIAHLRVEFFPRVQPPDSLPLCINMPFFGGGGAFVKQTGAHMTADEFLRVAARSLVTAEQRAELLKLTKIKPIEVGRRAVREVHGDPAIAAIMLQDAGKGIEKFEPDVDPELKMWCALCAVPPDIDYHPHWFKIACALENAFRDDLERGFELLHDWCCLSPVARHHDRQRNRAAWHRVLTRKDPKKVRPETIFFYATEYDPARKWLSAYYGLIRERAAS